MISSTEFAGRTAFVTGAGTGIGAATSIALAAHGAQVALFGRRKPRSQNDQHHYRPAGEMLL